MATISIRWLMQLQFHWFIHQVIQGGKLLKDTSNFSLLRTGSSVLLKVKTNRSTYLAEGGWKFTLLSLRTFDFDFRCESQLLALPYGFLVKGSRVNGCAGPYVCLMKHPVARS